MPATPPPSTASQLLSGQQVGHYQVAAKLGEGGMGEVYRARDTRLNREVALKVLPQTFAADPYRMARFQREAQLLASLNHPKIAAIYGLEESGSTRALVMELVEGPTLAERIGRASQSARSKAASASPAQASAAAVSGPKTGAQSASAAGGGKSAIPLDEALPIAQQLAEALEYAHEHGIIHRDLKPANIKVTPDGCVKVLDFGLAKAMSPENGTEDISNSPTLSVAMTQVGFIIGTAAYMAPEQAKGKSVDRRADIWAFGCVLYEMLAGKKTFEGETVSDVLAAVIKSEPDWAELPQMTPEPIRRLIRRCLVKDPKQRLRDIGDARITIEETLAGTATEANESAASPIAESSRTSRLMRALPWALAGIAVMFAAAAGWLWLKPTPQPNVVQFAMSPPEGATFVFGGEMGISPDGRTLAFIAQAGPDKPQVLWLRPLDSVTAQPVTGTEGAEGPVWSPDGQQIEFHANGKLEKIAVTGGIPMALCDEDFPGGSWSRNGVIVFTNYGNVYTVPDTGGEPTLVATPNSARGEFFQFPQFLPDGRHFIVQVRTGTAGADYIATGSLDSKTVERLTPATTNALYALGYLFYMDQNTLMERPFDAKALHFTGGAVPVAQNVGMFTNVFYGYFSVSPAGVLAYNAVPGVSTNQMTWFSREGKKLGVVGQPDVYTTPALSPDGSRLAVAVGALNKHSLWVYDLKRGTGSRLTLDSADNLNPVWSADGNRILFSSNRTGVYDIYQQAADGLGSAEPVFQSKDHANYLNDMTADGRYAIFDSGGDSNTTALWGLPLFGDRKPLPFLQGGIRANSAQFSPNGRYLAYSSNETGRYEIYVQTFPEHAGKFTISASGGTDAVWRRDGKELYFLSPDQKLMAVDVNTVAGTFQAGIPRELFQKQLIPAWYWRNTYVASADGQRFLMITPATEAKDEPITVVVNWPAVLKR